RLSARAAVGVVGLRVRAVGLARVGRAERLVHAARGGADAVHARLLRAARLEAAVAVLRVVLRVCAIRNARVGRAQCRAAAARRAAFLLRTDLARAACEAARAAVEIVVTEIAARAVTEDLSRRADGGVDDEADLTERARRDDVTDHVEKRE